MPEKYVMYRYNSFIQRTDTGCILRIGNRQYNIKNEICSYEELEEVIGMFQEPVSEENIKLSSRQEAVFRFLLKEKCLAYSTLSQRSQLLPYLLRNYTEFDAMQKRIKELDIQGVYFTDVKQLEYVDATWEEKRNLFQEEQNCEGAKERCLFYVVMGRENLEACLEHVKKSQAEHYVLVYVEQQNAEPGVAGVFEEKAVIAGMIEKLLGKTEQDRTQSQIQRKLLSVTVNYGFLLLVDRMAKRNRMKNCYVIQEDMSIQNVEYLHFSLGEDGFEACNKEEISMEFQNDRIYMINHFIDASKRMYDLKFYYEFGKTGTENEVSITIANGEDKIEAKSSAAILIDAAEECLKDALCKLFLFHGVQVHVCIGKEELEGVFKEQEKVVLFQDKGYFTSLGVFIVKEQG